MKQTNTFPKLHFACSNDEYRAALNYILVTKKDIVACNSEILIVFKTYSIFSHEFIEAMPERFLIHKNHWRDMCKRHIYIEFKDNVIHVINDGYENLYPIVLENKDLKYVNYKKVIPKEKDKKEIDSIGIGLKNMEILNKSMFFQGDIKQVKITFFEQSKEILINPMSSDNGQFAIVMPCIIH